MKVFRSEALLDVILAAASILMIFLLVIQPGAVQSAHYRQATVAIGCFASAAGEPWRGVYSVYRRGNGGWRVDETNAGGLRTALKKAITADEGYSRLVLMVDFHGARCADPTNEAGATITTTLNQIPDLRGTKGWTIRTDLIPCRDRAQCETLLAVDAP